MTAGLPAPYWVHAVLYLCPRYTTQERDADRSAWKKRWYFIRRALGAVRLCREVPPTPGVSYEAAFQESH
eukprot:7347945-Pyramimonas_sp.AAC.1